MDLGTYLWKQRMTQLTFALKIGAYPHTINRIVKRRVSPKLQMAVRIVEESGGKIAYKDLLRNEDQVELDAKQKEVRSRHNLPGGE